MELFTTADIDLGLDLSLSFRHQQRLNRQWNEKVSDPFAFTPHDKKGEVSLDKVVKENTKFGKFASEQLKQIFYQTTTTQDDILRRQKGKKKVVAVGFGRSYDSEWLMEASLAGYQTWWLDVSDVACEMAAASMKIQHEKVCGAWGVRPEPVVKQGEIRSVLADPDSIELDLESVEVWYFCRTLGCLSTRSARIVLQQLGQASLSEEVDPENRNKVLIINALTDDNPGVVGKTSQMRSKKFIRCNATRGAGRRLKVSDGASHRYFDKKVAALTITGG